ncbi:MAG: hypothetical protein LUH10_07750 [Tannerellaceae bacterium]|nr:hypothetical protein [Tannerellaceae bacterium]
MEKKYEQPKENDRTLNEPAIKYGVQEEMKILPLTEEDLKDCITGEELREFMHQMIGKHFNK